MCAALTAFYQQCSRTPCFLLKIANILTLIQKLKEVSRPYRHTSFCLLDNQAILMLELPGGPHVGHPGTLVQKSLHADAIRAASPGTFLLNKPLMSQIHYVPPDEHG
jgi:hypothetical protein